MAAAVKPIPEGYHSVTPYLIFSGASDAIVFYKKALGAEEILRMDGPGGRVHHAEISIGIHGSCWPTSIPKSKH